MNYTLQLHGERKEYPVPPGLYELMSDLTREVLRDQPTLMYKYMADYLDTLVKVRDYSRQAGQLVTDVLDENRELLAFTGSLGLTWSEANRAAARIQGAFTRHKCRQELRREIDAKKEQERVRKESLESPSFQEYLETLNIDFDDVSSASSLIQEAYETFKAKKEQEAEHLKDVSRHTIEAILPKPTKEVAVKKKPLKRDSKLLVYEQSPQHSVISTWSTLRRQLDEEEANRLVFQRSPQHSVQSTWSTLKRQLAEEEAKRLSLEIDDRRSFKLVYEQTSEIKFRSKNQKESSSITKPESRISLPSYYDENQKVPMISETGELVGGQEESIVTLYSKDSVHYNRQTQSNNIVKLPSISDFDLESKPEVEKEIFEIIDKRPSKLPKYGELSEPLEGVTQRVEEALKEELSNIGSVVGKQSSAGVVRPASQVLPEKGTSSRAGSLKQSLSKAGSKYKVDFIEPNIE